MPIRHPSRCRVNRGEYFDAVTIHPGEDHAEAGTSHACFVQAPRTSGTTQAHYGAVPFGATLYELLFASDPGVDAVGRAITWTHNAAGALDAPIRLAADGPARPPGGLRAQWSCSATDRS